MLEYAWIAADAKMIHEIFVSFFYGFVTLLLTMGVIKEYFHLPLGGVPSIAPLVGRSVVAVMLLVAYPEISQGIASLADSLASEIGGLGHYDSLLKKAADKVKTSSVSWSDVGSIVVFGLSYICYLLLHFAVVFFDAAVVFCWVLLYIFSPLLIALFVLPQTAGATSGLFRSLFEVSAWKVVFSVFGLLLWKSLESLLAEQSPDQDLVKILCINILLALSVFMTPAVVHAFTNGGLSALVARQGDDLAQSASLGVATRGSVLKTAALPAGSTKRMARGMVTGAHSIMKHRRHQG